MKPFVDALAKEFRCAVEANDPELETVFFGGGTPSLLSGELWQRLTDALRPNLGSRLREWTLEANPRTFDAEKAQIWLETGVSRVSLGVQSFDQAVLSTLGRDHSPEEAEDAAKILLNGGFSSVSLDFMFAIPGQSLDSWRAALKRALDLDPDHISTYNLTYEEDTEFLSRFESGTWTQNADRDAEFFSVAHETLTQAGFDHYEVSNFAKPGHRSLHNQAYWAGANYLGIGPSAVSTLGYTRWKNVPDTKVYVEMIEKFGHSQRDAETLSDEDLRLERLGLGLRTLSGLPRADFEREAIWALLEEGLAECDAERFWLTLEGMMVADEVAAFLV